MIEIPFELVVALGAGAFLLGVVLVLVMIFIAILAMPSEPLSKADLIDELQQDGQYKLQPNIQVDHDIVTNDEADR